jgi:hypothetical protein
LFLPQNSEWELLDCEFELAFIEAHSGSTFVSIQVSLGTFAPTQ